MGIDRLRTIIGYDRICVLDAGQIAVSVSFIRTHFQLVRGEPN
jgi:ABC-type transport system involved in Fe-S cluster assembly fused permease/ATPase subunit